MESDPSSYLIFLIRRARVAGQADDGGQIERRCGQAEERPGRCAEGHHGKGDALFYPPSKPPVLYCFNPFFWGF